MGRPKDRKAPPRQRHEHTDRKGRAERREDRKLPDVKRVQDAGNREQELQREGRASRDRDGIVTR